MRKIYLLSLLACIVCVWGDAKRNSRFNFKTSRAVIVDRSDIYRSNRWMLQGMDIWKNCMISLEHTGWVNTYKLVNGKPVFQNHFPLTTQSKNNHCNVACFGKQFLNPGDSLPLLYITRCKTQAPDSLEQVLYVEHIDPVRKKCQLIQTIAYHGLENKIPHTTQWVVDNEHQMLIGFGNSREPTGNRHFFQKFRLPPYRGPQDSLIILTPDDLLESYFMEDYYQKPFQPVLQGATCYKGNLLLVTGFGTEERPSILYIWNIKKRCMLNIINLQKDIPYEMEDCTIRQDTLYVQTGVPYLFRIKL